MYATEVFLLCTGVYWLEKRWILISKPHGESGHLLRQLSACGSGHSPQHYQLLWPTLFISLCLALILFFPLSGSYNEAGKKTYCSSWKYSWLCTFCISSSDDLATGIKNHKHVFQVKYTVVEVQKLLLNVAYFCLYSSEK